MSRFDLVFTTESRAQSLQPSSRKVSMQVR